jgi:hypothetical protein
MLPPGEPLFLGRRDDDAVLDEGGGRIMVETGYAEDVHGRKPVLMLLKVEGSAGVTVFFFAAGS